MARHLFVCAAGRRVHFGPSPTEKGSIHFQVIDANRVPLVTLTLPAELAAVISEALNIEATAAAELLDPSPSCACGIADKARACVCGGGCINEPLPSLPLAEFFGLKKAGA